MFRKFLITDAEKCTECGICELVCSAVKEGEFNIMLSRIHLVRLWPPMGIAVACQLCEDPLCVRSCPRNALKISEKNGVILVDEDKCDGCSWCIEACNFGAITLHMKKKVAVVCDMCGGNPKCVEFCPQEALGLTTTMQIAQKMRKKVVEKLFSAHAC